MINVQFDARLDRGRSPAYTTPESIASHHDEAQSQRGITRAPGNRGPFTCDRLDAYVLFVNHAEEGSDRVKPSAEMTEVRIGRESGIGPYHIALARLSAQADPHIP